MPDSIAKATPLRALNIVISGTNFWNPGDDFVRDGVIRVLRELFPGAALNFLFYNFNADFFPQTKFTGIANYVSRGDLDQFRDSVDAIVIAGLSAGDEIKDLYRWVIENRLQDRVYLIGAGYENDYVAQHVSQEPEATIFKNARIIVGRTAKTPEFLRALRVPYAHVNCPAILSVPSVKSVPAGKKIERIGFSIQLPHGEGLVNHSCAANQSKLAIEMMLELARHHAVEVIAHHKTEYFYFLNALRGRSIPVLFSSFYQDLFELYPRYDLVVTTRLHSSLFANGHGIPGILINDTDRHTHTLDGFPHSVWVNTTERFKEAFARAHKLDLRQVATEAAAFKQRLLQRYVEVLSEPFGASRSAASAGTTRDAAGVASIPPDYQFNSEFKEQKLVRSLVREGMTIFDVGAHAGKYTKLFSLLAGREGWVFAFEPTPESLRRLAREVGELGLKNVTLLPNAVADRDGPVTLHQFPEEYSSWNGLGRPRMEDPKQPDQFVAMAGSVEVEAVTLDAFCRERGIERIDYLKLDVEGAELRALHGARELLEKKAIRFLQFEISLRMLEGLNTTARPVFDCLARHGYECHVITEDGRVGDQATDSSAFYENYIAMPVAVASRDGRQVQKSASLPLPIHFFTIVLNGRPFIEHHIKAFEQLPFDWHWHIVEGVAELNHDTAWSRQHGGRIAPEVHRRGLSRDGTSEYLDELAKGFPNNVTLYRKPGGAFWDGKQEMVNAPLANLRDECLLWQVDADELWTADQLITARNLFLAHPEKTAAFYFCHYFVGEKLVITTRNTYGNNSGYEWIRTWRFTPGCRWLAHEPPKLCRPTGHGEWADLSTINPLRHAETEAAGLVFQHFAYVTPEQLQFKETYYGYSSAVRQWKKLQEQRQFPVALSKHFDWVKDAAQVNTAESQRIVPIAVREESGQWQFTANSSATNARRVLFVRTDAIGDAVLAAPMLPLLRAKYPGAKIAVLCREHVADLYLACPFADSVICFNWQKVNDDEQARRQIVREIAEFEPDLILNSLYSRESVTEILIHAQQAPQVIGLEGDLSNISALDRTEFDRLYTRLLPSPGEVKPELERHRDFLAGLGIAADKLAPQVWTAPEDDALAEAFFKEQQLDSATTIALFPGAQHDWKVYPHFAEALRALADHRFLIFGGAEVSDAADQLAAQLPGPAINLCGKTKLREMAALFRKCRLYVGADSAGAHIACAVGLPHVVVLGGGHFGRFFPYSPLTSVACLPLECFGCNWACKFSTPHCVKSLDPEVVAEAIRRTLAGPSDKPRVFVQDSSQWPPRANSPRWKSAHKFLSGTGATIVSVPTTPLGAPASCQHSGNEFAGGTTALPEKRVAKKPTGLAAALTQTVSDFEPRRRVLNIISRLEKDHWLERNLEMYADTFTPWFDAATFLNWFAHTFQPKTYLEVGVRRGRSMAQVLVESPHTQAFGFDLWIPNYGSVPAQGIHTTNPGPEFVGAELRKLGVTNLPMLVVGDSHETLPKFFADPKSPPQFDLIFIDGDHSREGAKLDLDLAFAHLAAGGALVFDDIDNPSHLDLRDLWNEYKAKFPDHLFIEHDHGAGTGVAFRPPFDALRQVSGNPEFALSTTVGTSSSQPLVSVIVSTYAAEKYIRACLEDLEAQTISNQIEIIVIDSGSPENERVIVEEFQRRFSNIHYLRTERETLYAAWNRGVQMARGRYITNANADDSHRPDALERLVAALEAHPEAELAYGDYFTSTVPNDSFAKPTILRRVAHPPYHPATLLFYCVTGCHPMWRRTIFDRVGLFDPTYTAPGDYDFVLRAVATGLRAVHVPEFLSLFFQNPDGLSFQNQQRSLDENNRLLNHHRTSMPIQRLFRVDPTDRAAAARAWTALGNIAVAHEVPWLDNCVHDRNYAQFCYRQALRLDPNCAAALHNLAVAQILEGMDAEPLLAALPAAQVQSLRTARELGRFNLIPVEVPSAVEPIEFGGNREPAPGRVVPRIAAPPKHDTGAAVRWIRLGPGADGAASDVASLIQLLARHRDLGLEEQRGKRSEKWAHTQLETTRGALAQVCARFPLLRDGIAILHSPTDRLARVPDARWQIARTSHVTDRLPTALVKACNQMDELWVPSEFVRDVFQRGGVEERKLFVVPSAVDTEWFDPKRHEPLPLPRPAKLNFLAVLEWSARQGWDALMSAYLREFSADDDVYLYLRAMWPGQPDTDSSARIEAEIRDFARRLNLGDKRLPRFEFLGDFIPHTELPRLYRAADCVIAPSRASNWGRVVLEAMAMGRPVIATRWGSVADYLTPENSFPLDFELADTIDLSADEWRWHDQRWANPLEKSLRESMREVQRTPDKARARGEKARATIAARCNAETVTRLMIERLDTIETSIFRPALPPAPPAPGSARGSRVESGGPLDSRSSDFFRDVQKSQSNKVFGEPPKTAGRRPALPGVRVALEGSFLDHGSLSHVNRALSRALSQQAGIELTRVGASTLPAESASDSELTELARRLKPSAPRDTQITIRHAWPPNWQRPAHGAWVTIQPWEYGVLPEEWVERFQQVDEAWVPSEYARRCYVDSGVDPAKVKVIPNGIDPARFRPNAPPLPLATKKSFKFLFVGGTIHRKGPDVLLRAYLETFSAADDVCLVIKDFGGQSVYAGQTFEAQIRAAQSRPNAPEILYLDSALRAGELPGLYTACDALVHPYRGEGFGLPALEAMACGLPVVVTGGGATDDFATDDFAFRLPAKRQSISAEISGMKLARAGWLLEPDCNALVERMQWLASHRDEARAKGRTASEFVRREWTWDRAARIAAERLHELKARLASESAAAAAQRKSVAKPIELPATARLGHLGTARELFQAKKFTEAWSATAAAVRERPFHPEAHLLLGEIAQATGNFAQARQFAERAREMAPAWKPAQQFLKTLKPGRVESAPSDGLIDLSRRSKSGGELSVCLITKNEERFIGQCLESIRDVAAQIIVVDTGSTDWTCRIAERFGAEVYSVEWADDFSAARNAVLEKATGDWVLTLDADEELLPDQKQNLLKLMEDPTAMAWRLPMIDRGREEEGVSYVPRLFRNAPGLFYVGRVHEQVFSSVEVRRREWGLENKLGNATLLHHGYSKELVRDRDKIARNLRLLQRALADLPDEPNLVMNLGLELVRADQRDAGIEQYRRAFRLLSALPADDVTPELRETLLTQFCTQLMTEKCFEEIVTVLTSPLARRGGLTASMHFTLGLAFIELKEFAEAATQMRECVAKRNRPVCSPINKEIRKAGPNHCLALSLGTLRRYDEAEKAFAAALADDPRSRIVRFDFARLRAEQGQPVEALKALHELVAENPADARIWEFGGQIALSQPQFIEFACDWTGEATKYFPANAALMEQRAQALLLHGRAAEALPFWRRLAEEGTANHRAGWLIAETVAGQVPRVANGEASEALNQEFLKWYRRLLHFGAESVVRQVNASLSDLRPIIPTAVAAVESALAEAEAPSASHRMKSPAAVKFSA